MKRVEYGPQIPVRVEVLSEKNCRLARHFFCGNPAIDNFFQVEAVDAPTTVTYLVIEELYE